MTASLLIFPRGATAWQDGKKDKRKKGKKKKSLPKAPFRCHSKNGKKKKKEKKKREKRTLSPFKLPASSFSSRATEISGTK